MIARSYDHSVSDLNEVSLHTEVLLELLNHCTLSHAHPIIAHVRGAGTIQGWEEIKELRYINLSSIHLILMLTNLRSLAGLFYLVLSRHIQGIVPHYKGYLLLCLKTFEINHKT